MDTKKTKYKWSGHQKIQTYGWITWSSLTQVQLWPQSNTMLAKNLSCSLSLSIKILAKSISIIWIWKWWSWWAAQRFTLKRSDSEWMRIWFCNCSNGSTVLGTLFYSSAKMSSAWTGTLLRTKLFYYMRKLTFYLHLSAYESIWRRCLRPTTYASNTLESKHKLPSPFLKLITETLA